MSLLYNDDTSDNNGVESEGIGVAFCQQLLKVDTNWKQTSYNGNIRVRYAGIGYSYNESLNAFVPPQPYASWTLDNGTADWVSPLGTHTDCRTRSSIRSYYTWDESAISADNTTGWVLETPPSE